MHSGLKYEKIANVMEVAGDHNWLPASNPDISKVFERNCHIYSMSGFYTVLAKWDKYKCMRW